MRLHTNFHLYFVPKRDGVSVVQPLFNFRTIISPLRRKSLRRWKSPTTTGTLVDLGKTFQLIDLDNFQL